MLVLHPGLILAKFFHVERILFLLIVTFLYTGFSTEITNADLQINYTVQPEQILFGDLFYIYVDILTKNKETEIIFPDSINTIFQKFQVKNSILIPSKFIKKEKRYKNSLKITLQAVYPPYGNETTIESIPVSILTSSSNIESFNTEQNLIRIKSRLTGTPPWKIHPIRTNHFSYLQYRFWQIYLFIFFVLSILIYFIYKISYYFFYTSKKSLKIEERKLYLLQEAISSSDFFFSKKDIGGEKVFLDLLFVCVTKHPNILHLGKSTADLIQKITELRFSEKKNITPTLINYLQQVKELLYKKNGYIQL